ncbi:hypothetical protein CEUSTIGMA_g208.t1 [Chlamydomonas eustigma]|uniref:Uncharacterized protein n=1 Tax=Chlamydomonas eustigma TaxID=1157962 RepID=A0A250WQ16_9CHLO|nr:hypothetical protein CEUSTIGMA_g208.t1 [Chlamydomonas eustigma]|eukprot:GAX72752.1 hypothetical protein CEUSTIGMA_g208.t1 [Chlamydomonas eustigma]
MLPSYGGGYGSKRRGGLPVLPIACGVLSLMLLIAGFAYLSARSSNTQFIKIIQNLRSELQQAQAQASHEKAGYQHMEYQYRAVDRQLSDAQRTLAYTESELLKERETKGAECQSRVDDVEERLAYEREVNEALQKHMRNLEEAHRNRESDWHDLANRWKKYEEDAIAENHRLLSLIAELKNQSKLTSFTDPELPVEEPKERSETKFDINFHIPERTVHAMKAGELHEQGHRVQGEAAHAQQPPGSYQNAGPQQQQQQQQQQQGEHYHYQQGRHPQLHNEQSAPAPDASMLHHADIYADHYGEDQFAGSEDPLDHYWTHDGFAQGHDNFHGDHYEYHDRHDHYQHEDAGHYQHHGHYQGHDHYHEHGHYAYDEHDHYARHPDLHLHHDDMQHHNNGDWHGEGQHIDTHHGAGMHGEGQHVDAHHGAGRHGEGQHVDAHHDADVHGVQHEDSDGGTPEWRAQWSRHHQEALARQEALRMDQQRAVEGHQQQHEQLHDQRRHMEGSAQHHEDGTSWHQEVKAQHDDNVQQQQERHAPSWGHGDSHTNPRWHSGSHEHGHVPVQQQGHHDAQHYQVPQPAPQNQQQQGQRSQQQQQQRQNAQQQHADIGNKWQEPERNQPDMNQGLGRGAQQPVPRGARRQHDDLNYKLGF